MKKNRWLEGVTSGILVSGIHNTPLHIVDEHLDEVLILL